MNDIKHLMQRAHELSKLKGFWSADQDHIAIKAERVHCEVSELVDAFARGEDRDPDSAVPWCTRAEIEWADCILRLFDLGERFGFSPIAIEAKLEYNATRPLRHGGKKF